MEQYLFLMLKNFRENQKQNFGKFDFFEMNENKSFDIDTLKDLEIVRKILDNL